MDAKLECLDLMKQGTLGDHPDEHSLWKVAGLDVKQLTAAASVVRDRGAYPNVMSFSPKVFIPLTRACRDACGYCTFALPPNPGQAVYMTVDEVLEVAKKGAAAGCTEALFTVGDKPELLYPRAKEELAALGHRTTISYVAEVAKIVLEETGLLPHINAGVLSQSDVACFRRVSVSQGLMLETISKRLLRPGGAHYMCPDKVPSVRIATIVAAGEERVPFTSGLLVGIGETREERIRSLLELRSLHRKYGHLQELIVQNFCSKKGTLMESATEPSLEELQWTIAMTRLAFGPSMNIQAPPNLAPKLDAANDTATWIALIEAGINDWGGISPITKDWVNPEAPWPHLSHLAAATSEAGKVLVPRLAIYPTFVQNASNWVEPDILKWVLENSNSLGFARGETWSPGIIMKDGQNFQELGAQQGLKEMAIQDADRHDKKAKHDEAVHCIRKKEISEEQVTVGTDGTLSLQCFRHSRAHLNRSLEDALQAAMAGMDLSKTAIIQLFKSMGPEFEQICEAADQLRSHVNGKKVTYVVNRNINYTNVCGYKCQFCAFSKGKANELLRGKPYRLSLQEIANRASEAWDRGATEVCMQGGIHPEYTGETYLEILRHVKEAAPKIHVHAFSPLEVYQGAASLGISVMDFLCELKKTGLGSLPGTAAEILDERVRAVLCADKITTQQWLEVMETAHQIGLKTTSTIMFGHIDGPEQWATHLLHLRNLQKRTGGFTEFVPLPFVHMEAPIFMKGRCRKGPTRRECILMHAVSRLVLHPYITNIQASWVKMGPRGAQALLMAGCNDMGGSLMNESISRAAGASYGQELNPKEMENLIYSIGRIPQQRSTLYGIANSSQVEKSFVAAPLRGLSFK